MKSKIPVHFSIMLVEKILRFIVSLYIFSLLSKIYGAEGLGMFQYGTQMSASFAFLATLSLDSFFVSYAIQNKDQTAKILGSAFLTKLLGFVVGIMLCLIYVFFVNDVLLVKSIILILSFSYILSCFDVYDLHFQINRKNEKTAFSKLAALLISAILRIWILKAGLSLKIFAAIQILEILLITLFQIYQTKFIKFIALDYKEFVKLLKLALPLIMSSIFVLIYSKADQLILARWVGYYDLGIYTGAFRLIEYTFILTIICSTLLLPHISIYAGSVVKLLEDREFKYYFFLYNLLAFAISFVIFIFAPIIVKNVLGNEFEHSIKILRILCFAIPFVFFGVIRHVFLLSRSKNIVIFKIELFSAILSLIANYSLTPRLGAMGVAISFLSCAIIINIIGVLLSKDFKDAFTLYIGSFNFFK